MCAVISQGRSVFSPNGSRSARRSLACTRGSARWESTRARPWPGACLPTGWTPAASRPAATARPSRATVSRIGREGAVADDVAGARQAEVQHRRGCHVEAGGSAVQADQRAGQERGAQPGGAVAGEAPAERGRRRMRSPMRRAEAGDAAALLVHHQHGVARQDPPQRCGERRQLRWVEDVAREQDRAGRRVGAEQSRFVGQQVWAGDADDGGLHGGSIARHTPESLPPDAAAPAVFENRRRHRLAERVPVNAGAAASPLN